MKHFHLIPLIWISLVLFLSFTSCKVYHEVKTEDQVLRIDSKADIPQDKDIAQLISPYKEKLGDKMNEVIGVSVKELTKKLPECTLGNWASDAVLAQCNKRAERPVDFAFVNYGGLRIPAIQAGNMTRGKMFELMPFDNEMVILEVSGNVAQQLFENIAQRGGWPISKGVACTFTSEGKLLKVLINGEALDTSRKYRIGLSDYVANGGDKCSFFKGIPMEQTGIKLRDAFIQQAKDTQAQGKKIDAKIEGRMVVEK